jgi:hypothetical protein
MAAFKALCEGFLGVEAHCQLFHFFFKFVCLKDNRDPTMIGCGELQAKQGRSDVYILASLTSSNRGWCEEWFYLKNNPLNSLPAYTSESIGKAPKKLSYGPEKAE